MDLEKHPQQRPAQQSPTTADPATVDPAAIRASDADRDRIADILRDALAEGRLTAEEHSDRIDGAYSAKTVGELEPLVRDLPAAGASTGATYTASSVSQPGPVPAEPDENLVAIFSSSTRRGRWRVARRTHAYAIFGNVEIDLSEALFEHQHIVIKAISIFGNVEVTVPENVSLRGTGSGILGNFEVDTLDSTDAQAPVVHVDGYAILGNIEAKPKRGRLIENLSDQFRKHLGH